MRQRVIAVFDLPDAGALSTGLVEALSSMEVLVFGFYGLPEQTPPDSARAQFGANAEAVLDELAGPLREAGAAVTTQVVFGKDREKAVDRLALEEDCHVELYPGPATDVGRILVPLVDPNDVDDIAEFVAALSTADTRKITLLHASEAGVTAGGTASAEAVRGDLDAARTQLSEHGCEAETIDVSVVEGADHEHATIEAAAAHDAVVMNKVDPDLPGRVFRNVTDIIRKQTGTPIFLVR